MRGRRLTAAVTAGLVAASLTGPAAAQSIDDVTVPFKVAGDTFRSLPGELHRGVSGPLSPALDALTLGACDPTDPVRCLLPFPNDRFTTADASTPTGRRVDLPLLGTPRNVAGVPVRPTEWNRNDGFSPGALIMTRVADLDLGATFRLPDGVDDQIQLPSASIAADAPIVLLDTHTGERHPYWAELDTHPDTAAEDQLLLIRPLDRLVPGRRYVVALRDLVATDGSAIAAGAGFAALRDGTPPTSCPPGDDGAGGPGGPPDEVGRPDRPGRPDGVGRPDQPGRPDGVGRPGGAATTTSTTSATAAGDQGAHDGWLPASPAAGFPDCPGDLDGEAGRYQRLFGELTAAGVEVDDLVLAWDFTVASSRNLAGRSVALRDGTFAALGDADLTDGTVAGAAPTFTITSVTDRPSDREIRGTVEVPNYLTLPQDLPRLPPEQLGTGIEQYAPGSRFVYGSPLPGPMDTPQVNPLAPTLSARFACYLPAQADADDPATPTLYGHGLLGGIGEAAGGSTSRLRADNFLVCATPWMGMATEDVANVVTILNDVSFFPSLVDRSQQGFLNFHLLGRLLIHPDGFASHPAFQDDQGRTRFSTDEVVYDGNSQGGILGGALLALAPDARKGSLGVPGGNYSTLLNRSVDWEGAYGDLLYAAYPDKIDQQLIFALIQMLWDRSETNGYAHAMTTAPLPNTPPHQTLLQLAFADHQVANVAAEVDARTVGARLLQTSLAPGRHWADVTGERAFGLAVFDLDADGRPLPLGPGESAIMYVDSGNDLPPNGNVPPRDQTDPHGDPRADTMAHAQKAHFLRTGEIRDPRQGQPYWADRCRGPAHPRWDAAAGACS